MTEAELAALAEDIDAAIRSDLLLHPKARLSGSDLRLVDDFAEALAFANHRYITDEEYADTWSDLRAREVSRLFGRDLCRSDHEAAIRRLMGAGAAVRRGVDAAAPQAYLATVYDIAIDLENIVLSWVGAGTGLFTRMWEIYRQGGWPCGWEGAYPQGRLVAFQPPIAR